jgi:hypothetical protein
MKNYLRTLQISLVAIMAAIGVGVVAVYPITPNMTSDCLYNDYLNGVYDPTATFSSHMDGCLIKPVFLTAAVTFGASMLILLLLLRALAFKEISKHFVMITGAIYAPLQLVSLLFIQSNHLWEAQKAMTAAEILRSYWFAIDPIVYFLLAASIAWWMTYKKRP